MYDIIHTVVDVTGAMGSVLYGLGSFLLFWGLTAFWLAWATFAVDWKKGFAVLREGGAIALGLIVATVAIVWAGAAPGTLNLGFVQVPNFLWQLLYATFLVGVTLLCGRLQLRAGWHPSDVSFAPVGGHGHGDQHGHHHNHDHGHGGHAAHGSTEHGHGGH